MSCGRIKHYEQGALSLQPFLPGVWHLLRIELNMDQLDLGLTNEKISETKSSKFVQQMYHVRPLYQSYHKDSKSTNIFEWPRFQTFDQEFESEQMRPLAKAVTKTLERVRSHLREQVFYPILKPAF